MSTPEPQPNRYFALGCTLWWGLPEREGNVNCAECCTEVFALRLAEVMNFAVRKEPAP